jgi:RNA polymerase sigma-70 factor, ECF subfamily
MSTALQSEDLAFESLYRLHRPPVYAYALATLRHAADAEDVTQTTFLNAYCALRRGVAPRDDLQWLLAIARNACRDRFRDAKRHPREQPLADWMTLVEPERPEYTVDEVCKEIAELNPRYRQILLMREFEGRSYTEISAQLGVSEPTVQTLLARARRALRDELELGISCAQARRISLRHLNAVALRDERRALQRHLRKCADCATFVGRTPRTPVTRMLWLVWLPYRRFLAIIAGTSATSSSTATVGVLTKLATITVVGGTAVTVGVKETTKEPAVRYGKPIPTHARTVAKQHGATAVGSGSVGNAWRTSQVAGGRAPLTHATHAATASRRVGTSPASTFVTGQPSSPAGEPSGSAAPAPVGSHEPEVVQSSPSSQDAPQDSGATPVEADAAPTNDATASSVTDASNAAVPDSAPAVAPNLTSAPPTSSAPDPTPVASSSEGIPAPASGRETGSANGNAVGQGNTPPGQVGRPEAPQRGHP